MKKLFCKLGWHWLEGHSLDFVDKVSNKTIYRAKCSCGRLWNVDSLLALAGGRVELSNKRTISECEELLKAVTSYADEHVEYRFSPVWSGILIRVQNYFRKDKQHVC